MISTYIKISFLLGLIFCVTNGFAQSGDSLRNTLPNLFSQKGYASFYAQKFEGRKTANGERYSNKLLTAAHRTLPFNTLIKVSNPRNGRWVIVRINDRGPYVKKRIIDLSERAARHIGVFMQGHAKVVLQELPVDTSQVWKFESW